MPGLHGDPAVTSAKGLFNKNMTQELSRVEDVHGTSRTSSTTGCNEGKFQQQGGAHIPSQLHKR